MYGEGISKMGELVDLAVKLDIVHNAGSWFSMGDTRACAGRAPAFRSSSGLFYLRQAFVIVFRQAVISGTQILF